MSVYIAALYSLAARVMLDGAHIPIGSGSGSASTSISPTTTPTPASSAGASSPSASAATSSAPASNPNGPIPRHFRLQIISPTINTEWNNQPVTARDDLYFGIDGTTSQTCNATNCGTYPDTTTFTIANGYAQLYNGANLQQTVFIDQSTGSLQYAGSAGLFVPNTALRTGLVVRAQSDGSYAFVYNDGQDRKWTGCSQRPGYPEYIGVNIVGECESGMDSGEPIAIQAIPVSDPGAWAYGPPPTGPCITPSCP